jgi:hypothetical protein
MNSSLYIDSLEEVSPGIYKANITVPPTNVAGYVIRILAQKQHHQTLAVESVLHSELIQIGIGELSTLQFTYEVIEGDTFNLTIELVNNETGLAITDANVEYSIFNSTMMLLSGSLTEISPGVYSANVDCPPACAESYSLRIVAEKEHHSVYESEATLYASLRAMHLGPLTVMLAQSVFEYRVEQVVLELLDSNTEERITGLDIAIKILGDNGTLVSSWSTVENEGLYHANITIPSIGEYTLEVVIALEHYRDFGFNQPLISVGDPRAIEEQMLGLVVTGAAGAFALVFAFGLAVMVRRRLHSRRTERAIETLAIMSRFDDARNILGGLILRRRDGLPVFSKIVSGVFEEAMTSGFISAITSFRTEIRDVEPIGIALPISDVITAVMTPTLTFALVTYTTPSADLKSNLQEFSKVVSDFFGEELSRQTPQVPEPWLIETLAAIFSTQFDLSLLRSYCGIKDDCEARDIASLRKALTDFDVGLTPDAMIRMMIAGGVDEGSAYRLVIHAIDNELLNECVDSLDPLDTSNGHKPEAE